MRSIDIHAHLTPQCFIHAMEAGKEWHGIKPGSVRIAPRAVWTPEQRLADMKSLGKDAYASYRYPCSPDPAVFPA